jgi:decaprenylphospho-beta-D-ribofuranose 2-oxidase
MKMHGWGRYPVIEASAETFELERRAAHLLTRPGHWLARGLGKSYGDSALNHQLLLTGRYNKFLAFDPLKGTITCQSGVTLAELIDFLLPKGWFLKVTPGTKLITVGGAIASDVHGKNHHVAGCFSAGVISFRLMLPNGTIVVCTPQHHREIFLATCGGMGLTGLILEATLALQPVQSAFIRETVVPCSDLTESFTQFERFRRTTYSVAWIDCLARGRNLGRAILMAGEHSPDGGLVPPPSRNISVPMECPAFLLNPCSVAAFNRLYFHLHNHRGADRRVPIDPFFYPLDRIDQWNRMYGPGGFTQYQFVLPKAASFTGLREVLKKISAAGLGSFLAVLKLFGPQNDNYLSFPMEGYTLALDFKIQPELFGLLDQLDCIVLAHGGRIYLTKDVRMGPRTFRQGYAHWEKFATLREQHGLRSKFNSLQSRRLEI